MTTTTKATTAPIGTRTFNPIKWLLDMDAAYRQADALKKVDDHLLRDMGLTREQADTAFYQQFGPRRNASK